MLIFLSIKKLNDLLSNRELSGGVGINKCVAFTHLTIVLVLYFSQLSYQALNYYADFSRFKDKDDPPIGLIRIAIAS